MSGQTKCGLAGSNGIGALIALAGLTVLAINVIQDGFHFFVDGLQVLGFCTLAWLAVKARIWWLGFKARLSGQVPYVQQLRQETISERRQQQPIYQQPQQALPQGNVTNDYGHKLLLPAEWSPEQIRAFRGEN